MLAICLGILGCSSDNDESSNVTNPNNPDSIRVPVQMQITKAVITSFPGLNPSGAFWDISSGKPDIYLELHNKNGALLFNTGTVTNADFNTQYTAMFTTPIVLRNIEELHQISLYDEDNLSSEIMAFQYFTPYLNNLGTPETIIITNAEQAFQVVFTVTYQY